MQTESEASRGIDRDLTGLELWARIIELARLNWRGSTDRILDVIQLVGWLMLEEANELIGLKGNDFVQALKRIVWRAVKATNREVRTIGMEYDDQLGAPYSAVDPAVDAMDSETRLIFKQVVDKLEPTDRRCIQGIYFDGISLAELARQLGVTPPSVKKRLQRILKRIKSELERRGVSLSVVAIAFALVSAGRSAVAEERFLRLVEAAPSIAAGGPIPPDALTPGAAELYAALISGSSGTVSKVATAKAILWGGGSVVTIAGCALTWMFLTAAPEAANRPVENGQKVVTEAVVAEATRPLIRFAGGFPMQPIPGQIHTLAIGNPPVPIDFCYIPASDKGINDFWASRTEVTQRQWTAIKLLLPDGSDRSNPSYRVGDELPVEQFSAERAELFVEEFSRVTGVPVRLPTIAEWQHAASAGTNESPATDHLQLSKVAWFDGNSGMKTHPVGMLEPNQWNLCDCFGNVFEYAKAGPGSYEIRGGSAYYKDFWCSSTYASPWPNENNPSGGIGIRIIVPPLEQENVPQKTEPLDP